MDKKLMNGPNDDTQNYPTQGRDKSKEKEFGPNEEIITRNLNIIEYHT